MLTVIITTDEASAFLQEYRPLFAPFEQEGEILFCHWNEQGTDFKTALPELYAKVYSVPEWRAIVALPFGRDARGIPSVPPTAEGRNPFDFPENLSGDGKAVTESAIPLVRLAQMLGGVPEPYHEFADEIVGEGRDGMRRTVAHTDGDEFLRQKKNWLALEEKYRLPCEKPAELWLLAARHLDPITARCDAENRPADSERFENNASLFALRNRYPARTRFFTMDCAPAAHAHFHTDEMRFWMAVLSLALNEYDGGAVRAGCLYTVDNSLDEQTLQKLLSHYYNRLTRIRREVDRRAEFLRKQQEEDETAGELPVYRLTVTVKDPRVEADGLTADTTGFGLARDCPESEAGRWRGMMEESRKALAKAIMAPRRFLDRACVFTRRNARIDPLQVNRLDHYQLQELDGMLQEEEIEIFNVNTFDAFPVREFYRRKNKADRATRTYIRSRMERNTAIAAGVAALLLYIAGFVPELVHVISANGAVKSLLGALGLRLAVIIPVGILTLMWFRHGLLTKIRDYNGVMYWILDKISSACRFFSDYLTMVCSYMRGRSIADALAGRSLLLQEESERLARHQLALEASCRRTAEWLEQFSLPVLEDTEEGQWEYFNSEIPPDENEVYDLRVEHALPAADDEGRRVLLPYPFATALTLRREVLFERTQAGEEAAHG